MAIAFFRLSVIVLTGFEHCGALSHPAIRCHRRSSLSLAPQSPPGPARDNKRKQLLIPRRLSATPSSHRFLTMTQSSEAVSDDGDDHSSVNKLVLWIGSTTSMVVAFTFFAVLALKRDALMVAFFIGAITNGILSKVLKKVLNQERPAETNTVLVKDKPSDKGMPSSHAMSLGFIGTFTALTLPQTQVLLLMYVAISLYYRVYTQLHTKDQVAVGLLLGMLNGALWRSLCSGTNAWFPSVNVLDWMSATVLNDEGLLPMSMLVVPALMGLAVVGSFERRISKWIKSD